MTIQCLLIQEIVILKNEKQGKKKLEFELAMQSKQPNLPKGVSEAELDFSFDLNQLFSQLGKALSQKFPTQKQESLRSQFSSSLKSK